jgi:hypothetical protein
MFMSLRRWASQIPFVLPRRHGAAMTEIFDPVRRYAAALDQASADNAAFDEVISQLRVDPSIRRREMREIALLYLGYWIARSKGRADALQAIVDRQALPRPMAGGFPRQWTPMRRSS